jgi:hypothetical protein
METRKISELTDVQKNLIDKSTVLDTLVKARGKELDKNKGELKALAKTLMQTTEQSVILLGVEHEASLSRRKDFTVKCPDEARERFIKECTTSETFPVQIKKFVYKVPTHLKDAFETLLQNELDGPLSLEIEKDFVCTVDKEKVHNCAPFQKDLFDSCVTSSETLAITFS